MAFLSGARGLDIRSLDFLARPPVFELAGRKTLLALRTLYRLVGEPRSKRDLRDHHFDFRRGIDGVGAVVSLDRSCLDCRRGAQSFRRSFACPEK